ncbi:MULTISPECIES: autotransporter outer membrane beta-barrel domain-containing protein [unclassified Bartonella]|uniref:autotransporter outer membrane beta-barrel domain-containing protein n=2 Tax=Bartonella TaxID=773 RepID=UPI0009992487|nr:MULTISPECIES: autotransporter outer membrane beta-barrel domain-containing protein [unclassified Bartonella]AQX23039.1 outer membrane autotransporter barrel domain-containing protein [Bartonella sp. 11B]AQX23664.1 outer membrane autotransporter barrel domain-containing protein [Bartonella sp. 114]
MRYKLISAMLVIDISLVQAVSSNSNIDTKVKAPVPVLLSTSSNDLKTFPYGQGYIREEQNVSGSEVVWNAKVMEGGIQNLYAKSNQEEGGTAVNTEVFRDGRQRVSAEGTAITVTLNDNAVQEIYKNGYVYGLTVNDRASSWAYAGATLEGDTTINDFGKFLLYAGDKEHRSTIENFILKGKETELFVISARDEDSALIKKLSGQGTVSFIPDQAQPRYSHLYIEKLSGELGSLHFRFNTTIAEDRGDYLFIESGDGHHMISVADSGAEITNPLSQHRDLVTDKSAGSHFTLVDLSGVKINAVDGGTYMYALKQRQDDASKIWYLAADHFDKPNLDLLPTPTPSTTPSTDAVLSLAVAPELVFNNELQSLRVGRGILGRNKKNTAFWTYGIKGRDRLATGHTHFRLDQTGIILGVDWLQELMKGDFYIGGFGSYDQARITHARGGVSNMDTYSAGAYATYFDNQGWYLDSVLKYNYYTNNLKAISTNGLGVQGDYNQWAIGTSFEAGYYFNVAPDTWIQPYTQLTGVRVSGKEVKLSNQMVGNVNSSTSLRSEAGLSVGHKFNLNDDAHLMTYITTAWLREYIDRNHTIINNQHKFITDLSRDAGKLGIGLHSLIGDNLSLYAETQYLKGHKVEQSLQGIVGLRYSF